MSKWTAEEIPDQSGRVAVVTGANSGIGYETAKALAKRGAYVILACRSEKRATEALETMLTVIPSADVQFVPLDLADLDSVQTFADRIHEEHDRLDLLINNAGVMIPPESTTAQGFELQIGVNHFGHFALTAQLLDKLVDTPGSRVVTVSSIAHRQGKMDFDDINYRSRGYKAMAAYGQSKLANLLFMFELHRRLTAAGSDTKSLASHPGVTKTNLQRHMGMLEKVAQAFCMEPPQGALPSLRAATDPDAESGEYYGPRGIGEMWGYPSPAKTSRRARNESDAQRLWAMSEELTGVSMPI